MAFTLRQLRYFLAAAENGSVSGAAQVLAISQSAVTEAIRDLEADLGMQLFERHPRGLNITPRGHQFLRHAQTILGTVSDAQQAMVQEARALSGSLNIGVTSLVAGYVISDIQSRFRRANPGVEVAAQLVRHYPQGAHFAHSVGYVGRINEQEIKQLDPVNYSGTHHIGKTGIEKIYEDELHGQVGYEEVETNARGRVLRVL